MAHLEPLLRRTEPKHLDAATFPGLRRLHVVDRRSEGPDLDARTGHACVIGIRAPSRIVPPVPTERDSGTEAGPYWGPPHLLQRRSSERLNNAVAPAEIR